MGCLRQFVPRVMSQPQRVLAVAMVTAAAVLLVVKMSMDREELEELMRPDVYRGRTVGDKVQVRVVEQDSDQMLSPGQQVTLDAHDATTDEDHATFVEPAETGSPEEEELPRNAEQDMRDENNESSGVQSADSANKAPEVKKIPDAGNTTKVPETSGEKKTPIEQETKGKQDSSPERVENHNNNENKNNNTGNLDLNSVARETTAKLAPAFLQAGPSDQYTNLLDVNPPKYLENYRNPCWFEIIEKAQSYELNVYRKFDHYVSTFVELEDMWKKRLEQGQNWRLRCLPYFYIVGMPKCGTSELYTRLRMHPDVTRGPMKETHYWTRWRVGWMPKGFVPIRNFVDMFDLASHDIQQKVTRQEGKDFHPMVFGDGSVTTLYENDWFWKLPENGKDTQKPTKVIPDYLHHIQSEARIIAILRDPVERLYSDYLFFPSSKLKSPETFHQFAIESTKQMTECLDQFSLDQCIYNGSFYRQVELHMRESLYAPFVRSYLKTFPRGHVKILRLEDYSKDRIRALNDVLHFLGLSNMPQSVVDQINDAAQRNHRRSDLAALGAMQPQTRALLRSFYKPFNTDLASLLDDDRFLWEDV